LGCIKGYSLSLGIINYLESRGIHRINQIENDGYSTIWDQAWLSGTDLNLDQQWMEEWHNNTKELSRSNFKLRNRLDQLVWAHAPLGIYSPKYGYKFLMSKMGWGNKKWQVNHIWKLKFPTKSRILFWCILRNKVPTWYILQRRFKSGPSRCALCKNDIESIQHLFLKFPFTRAVWLEYGRLLRNSKKWEGEVLTEVWQKWWKDSSEGNL